MSSSLVCKIAKEQQDSTIFDITDLEDPQRQSIAVTLTMEDILMLEWPQSLVNNKR